MDGLSGQSIHELANIRIRRPIDHRRRRGRAVEPLPRDGPADERVQKRALARPVSRSRTHDGGLLDPVQLPRGSSRRWSRRALSSSTPQHGRRSRSPRRPSSRRAMALLQGARARCGVNHPAPPCPPYSMDPPEVRRGCDECCELGLDRAHRDEGLAARPSRAASAIRADAAPPIAPRCVRHTGPEQARQPLGSAALTAATRHCEIRAEPTRLDDHRACDADRQQVQSVEGGCEPYRTCRRPARRR